MTTDEIMALADAYAELSFEQGLGRTKGYPEESRIALRAEVEQLTKEAGRYRWLRDECADHHIGVYDHASNDKRRFWLQGAELDSEVDAAMQPKE